MSKKNLHAQSLTHAIHALKPYKKYIRAIYLYGSCVRREQTEKSDVDIFVFVNNDVSPQTMRKMRSCVIPEDRNLPDVDIHFSKDDTFGGSKIFHNTVKREAKKLWPVN